MVERKGLELVPRYLFLKKLRETYPIGLIYYPGSGSNTSLEENFSRSEIICLDSDRNELYKRDSMSRIQKGNEPAKRVTASYGNSPFKDEVFDAIFFEDNHAEPEDFEEMLRTLKPGGLVIAGDTCFGGVSKIEILKTGNLKRVRLPFRHDADAESRMIVLQKVGSGRCEVPKGWIAELDEGFDLGMSQEID